jgi:hypothetical protein
MKATLVAIAVCLVAALTIAAMLPQHAPAHAPAISYSPQDTYVSGQDFVLWAGDANQTTINESTVLPEGWTVGRWCRSHLPSGYPANSPWVAGCEHEADVTI